MMIGLCEVTLSGWHEAVRSEPMPALTQGRGVEQNFQRVIRNSPNDKIGICSVHGYTTRRPANTSCPRSGRFRLRELRVSRHFSTFYGSSVQSMDTQLGARQGRRTLGTSFRESERRGCVPVRVFS